MVKDQDLLFSSEQEENWFIEVSFGRLMATEDAYKHLMDKGLSFEESRTIIIEKCREIGERITGVEFKDPYRHWGL